jgi:hypothetical protein
LLNPEFQTIFHLSTDLFYHFKEKGFSLFGPVAKVIFAELFELFPEKLFDGNLIKLQFFNKMLLPKTAWSGPTLETRKKNYLL